jgi:PEP-CTERM motif
VNRCTFLLSGTLVIASFANNAIANPSRYWVNFTGHITGSYSFDTGGSPFADFVAGSTFSGTFLFDYDLVDYTDSLVLSSGAKYRYFSGVRDFLVNYQLPTGTYTYQPPVYGDGDYAGTRLNSWGVSNDAAGYADGLDMRFLNYPVSWVHGPIGVTFGYVPPSEFVDGLYPHSSFFDLLDTIPPLDTLDSTSALFDMADLFSKSNTRTLDLRFTDPNDPNWWSSGEQLYAVVSGDITALSVSLVPEPSTVMLAAFGLAALAASGWRRKR